MFAKCVHIILELNFSRSLEIRHSENDCKSTRMKKFKNIHAKLAKPLFFIVKYANL